MDLSFRVLMLKDVKTISKIDPDAAAGLKEKFDNLHVGVIASSGKNFVGFIVLGLNRGIETKIARLENIYVRPEYRRRGVAAALFVYVLNSMDESVHITSICCPVPEYRLDVQLWLKAAGFKAIKTVRNRWATDRYLMLLELEDLYEDAN